MIRKTFRSSFGGRRITKCHFVLEWKNVITNGLDEITHNFFKTKQKFNEEARKYLKHIQTTPDQYCDWK